MEVPYRNKKLNVTNLKPANQNPWLQRLKSSEREQAIEELRVYLVRGLSRSLRHRYGGTVQVEDIVQVALLKILDSIDTFQQRSRFETWSMAIAMRVGMSELRKRYYRDVSIDLSLDSGAMQIEFVDPGTVDDATDRQNVLLLLQRLINEKLSDKQRMAIRGSLEGLPMEEIAMRMNSNRNAVYKLVHDARLKLRQAFEAVGITAEDVFELIG